jgi:hypothetical protein
LICKKAEAQAKESQIEAALERVRSRSMGMQKSEELKEVIQVVYEQFVHLNIKIEHTGFVIDYKARDDYDIWIADPLGVPSQVTVPYFDSVYYNRFNEAKKNGEDFFATNLSFEEKNKFYQKLFEYVPGLPEEAKKFYFSCPGLAASTVLLDNVCLYIENFSGTPYSDDENNTLMRFGKVFQQTYTRFLDLQKAEAQAREAKIEAVLERIRSRTMAMQKSDELTDVAGLLFKQVTDIGIKTWTAGFNVWSEDNNSYVDYITSPNGGFIEPYTVYTDMAEALTDISNARKSGIEFDVQYVEGEKIKQLYLALTRLDEKQYEIMLQDGIRFPSHQYEHFVFGSKVSLMFITYEPVPEAHDIFKRLGKVFEQTYTRFLDLQKAEVQAREAQVETSLERIRSRTMGMQKSNELKDVATLLNKELIHLGITNFASCGYIEIEEKSNRQHSWLTNPDGASLEHFFLPLTGDQIFDERYDAWKRKDVVFKQVVHAKELKKHLDFAYSGFGSQESENIGRNFFPDPTIFYSCNFSYGYLSLITGEMLSHAQELLLARFTRVFEQTYSRFLDLQKAEAQAREAKIEAALERVRSRSMAMHHTSELQDVINTVYLQFGSLNIAITGGAFIAINEESKKEIACWGAGGTADYVQRVHIPFFDRPIYTGLIEDIQKGPGLFTDEFTYEEKIEFFNHIFKYPPNNEAPPERKREVMSREGGYTRSLAGFKKYECFYHQPSWEEIFGRGKQNTYTVRKCL